MNMLISWRAGRGERASPVLFLHRSDARRRGREWRKERRQGKEGGGGEKGNVEEGGAEEGERVGTLSKKSLELKKKRQSGNLDGRRSPRRAISRAGDK